MTSLLGRAKVRPGRGSGPRVASRFSAERPYATIALVLAGCATWIVWHAKPDLYANMAIFGPLHGDWWKLLSSQFAYRDGMYAFVALLTVAIFGWLFERRHGPAAVLGLFFGAGASGALVVCAVYAFPVVSGANAAALALLAAWAVPDLEAMRAGDYYEGDLLGAGAIAALLLAIPFARPEASWLAGVVGGAVGLLVGFGVHSLDRPDS